MLEREGTKQREMGVGNIEPLGYLQMISQSFLLPKSYKSVNISFLQTSSKWEIPNGSITYSWIQAGLSSQSYVYSYLNDYFLKCFVPINFLKDHNPNKRKSPEMLDYGLVELWIPFPFYGHHLYTLSSIYNLYMKSWRELYKNVWTSAIVWLTLEGRKISWST